MSTDNLNLSEKINELSQKFIDDCLESITWVAAASDFLKAAELPLSEENFVKNVIVSNARILCQLKILNDSAHTGKVFQSVTRLAELIDESKQLPATPFLNNFSAFAKSLFLQRVGDVLLVQQNHGKSVNEKLMLSFACYFLSFMELSSFRAANERLGAVQCLELVTLSTLLKRCPNKAYLKMLLSDHKLSAKIIQSCRLKESSSAFFDSSDSMSYDESAFVDEDRYIKQIWILNDVNCLFGRLIWLIAFNNRLSQSFLTFLDRLLDPVPRELKENRRLLDFNKLPLTQVDAKILLIMCAEWIKLKRHDLARGNPVSVDLCPCISVSKWTASFAKLFKTVFAVGSEMAKFSRSQVEHVLFTTSILEVTRLRREIPDLRIVHAVFEWLKRNECFVDTVWIEHYANCILNIIERSVDVTRKFGREMFGRLEVDPSADFVDAICVSAIDWLEGYVTVNDVHSIPEHVSSNTVSHVVNENIEISTHAKDEASCIVADQNNKPVGAVMAELSTEYVEQPLQNPSLLQRLAQVIDRIAVVDPALRSLEKSSLPCDWEMSLNFDELMNDCGVAEKKLSTDRKIFSEIKRMLDRALENIHTSRGLC